MINLVEDEVLSLFNNCLNSLGYGGYDLDFDYFPESSNSVLATTIAFEISNNSDTNPSEIANDIVSFLDVGSLDYVSEINNKGPYINVFASKNWYSEVVSSSKSDFYCSDFIEDDVCIGLEHTSVNPTGPLHIGRVRNSVIGDSLSNILDFAGFDVTSEYYVNDAGLQVAILVWGFNNYNEDDLSDLEYDSASYDLVRYYRKASKDLDEDVLAKLQKDEDISSDFDISNEKEVIGILTGLENGYEDVIDMVKNVVSKMLDSQIDSLNNIGVDFDNFKFETDIMFKQEMDDFVYKLKNNEYSKKLNGAWVIDSEKKNIDNFVFERSNGTSLYGTRDLLNQIEKLDDYDKVILVLGEDQKLHMNSVKSILDLLGYSSQNINTVYHSFVQGMSTRKGDGEFLENVLDEITKNSKKMIDDSKIKNSEEIAEKVAIGSLRYNLLSKSRSQNIKFNLDDLSSFKSSSGTSIQYSYTRLSGVLDKIDTSPEFNYSVLNKDIEYDLIKKISEFKLILEDCIDSKDPHKLASYVDELHSLVNQFYRDCNVKNEESLDKKKTWISLVVSVKNVMSLVFDLLGLPKLEKM
jgi:arginyl-tRNA synthetase